MNFLRRKWNDYGVESLNYRDDKQSTNINNHCTEYSKNSTIHGIKYIGDNKRPLIERILWICIAVISLFFCIKLLVNTRQHWEHGPIIVGLNEKIRPIWEIPFPTVTICPDTKAHSGKINFTDTFHMLLDANKLTNKLIYTETLQARMEAMTHICDAHLTENMNLGNKISKDNIFNTLREIAPTFEESLFFCKWRNEPRSCQNLFEDFWTEEGLCFTFNNLNSKDIFTDKMDDKYPMFNNNHSSNYWSLENGYTENRPSLNTTYPHQIYGSGPRAGIFALLRLNESEFDYICRGPVIGYKVALTVPGEIPQISKQFIRVPPEKEVIIHIKPNVVTASSSLRSYAPNDRGCYFNGEKELRFFKTYTHNNCHLECLADYTLKKCGCVKFSMPRLKNTPICGTQSIKCYEDAEDDLLSSGYKNNNINDEIFQCNCLPTCTSITYDAEISQAGFHYKELFQAFATTVKEFKNMQPSRLGVYFKENHYVAIKRYEIYSHSELLATCGGLLALFFGASILSIFEFIYFFTIRLFFKKQNSMNNLPTDFRNSQNDDSSLQL